MKVYPSGLVKWDEDILRLGSDESLALAKGLSFDAFLHFEQPVKDKQFMAIDVYTRFPVGNKVALNFCRKVRHVGNAFGLLLAKSDMATNRASFVCKNNEVGFATIEDLGTNYNEIRASVQKGEAMNYRPRPKMSSKQATAEWNRREGFLPNTLGKR